MSNENSTNETVLRPNERILRIRDVLYRTGLSRSVFYLHVKDGTFPAPIKIGKRSVGWAEGQVQAWINQQIAQVRK
ncbi:MAG: AlpA family transcriptional regulator [Alphaproteobacteria bacterium]|nr:AlpA family transcriptional regulator [Alphaproteobacteria bacterium]